MLGRAVFQKSGLLSTLLKANLSTTTIVNKNVAVVLSGCGVYDGTEVHEAAACLAALTRAGLEPVIYAPDKLQAHVIDHQSGSPMDQERNVLNESARIARGPIEPLTQLKADSADALVVPGGFGAAKNLSDFGFKGAERQVDPEVQRILQDFHGAGKPIGTFIFWRKVRLLEYVMLMRPLIAMCCIAPIIAAKVFGDQGVNLTLGKSGDESQWPYGGSLEAAASFGASVNPKEVSEVCVDSKMKIVTSPAYMYNGKFHEIQDGVTKMITELIKLMK